MSASRHPGERIGVYLCHCGTNIADTVDMDEVARYVRGLEGVAVSRSHKFLCADSGQKLIREDVEKIGLSRVVVGACSPLMHEPTFRRACQGGGLNPFNLQIANIREQISWVIPDRLIATSKSKAVLTAAVRRVVHHQPLHVRESPVVPAALVLGAGITGIEAALRLADAGKKVYLVEREPSIGGHMAMLDRTFPTMDCSACILVPKMAHAAEHPNISLLSYSEVESVSGIVGSYKVRVRSKARYVDCTRCNGCGLCVEKCPWSEIPSEFDQGTGTRSAIYFPFAQAVPHVPLIDRERCAYFHSETCRICREVCPTDAVDFEQGDTTTEVEVGSVILATGYRTYDPVEAPQYGYGRWENILTSLQFERLSHPAGPTAGRILMANGEVPRRIAVIHCAGSRDEKHVRHCSRICCMTCLKAALLARQRTGAEVFSFYIDMRAAGKHGEEFYEQAQRAGVVFVHGKGAEVIRRGQRLLVKAEDIVLGRRVIVPVDMVVLGVGLLPARDAVDVARMFGVGCTREGFFMERHVKFAPVQTANEGVFIAGACQGPKDIPDAVAQGGAAAACALALLDRGSVDTLPTVATVRPELCSGCLLCVDDCPYQAVERTEFRGREVVRINDVLCTGCGSCAATCPSRAISQHGYTGRQILSEIEGLLAVTP